MKKEKQTQKNPPHAQHSRVLIVEDDIPTLDALIAKLARMDIPAAAAKDGEEATEMIHAQPWDVVIIDILLPKKDGFALLEEIKKEPQCAHAAVLVFSNLSGTEYMRRALDLGAHEFIEKTKVSLEDMAQKIIASLNKKTS